MAKKITVADVFETHKTLTRYSNYANRYMSEIMPIAQASDVISEAREKMKKVLTDFSAMNVADLLPDMTQVHKGIERANSEIEWFEREVEYDKRNLAEAEEDGEADAIENYRDWLARDEAKLAEWNEKLKAYEMELAQD